MLAGILALVMSAMCLVGAVLAWSGRWRSWTRKFLWSLGAMPITLLPGLAAGSLAGGLASLGVISSSSAFGAACLAVLAAGVLLWIVTPRGWGPRWFRERDRSAPPDLGDPATAVAVAAVRATAPTDERPARSRAPVALGPPLKRWRGSWIAGPETDPAAHGLTHAGAVEGHLELHREAVSFVAYRVEDLLREVPTVMTIMASDLRAVRVVPRGAGADGRPAPAAGPRSLFSRLVLDTGDRAYLFEVQAAGRAARRIGDEFGVGASS